MASGREALGVTAGAELEVLGPRDSAYLLELHPEGTDHVSDTIADTRQPFEVDILEAIAPRLRVGDVVVDAGAHIGNHAAYLAQLPGVTVHAFEPWPVSRRVLRHNVGHLRNVHVYHYALGSDQGTREMVGDRNIGHARFAAVGDGDGVNVDVRPLDSFGFRGVRLLKVDVEGAEAEVLAGAAATLRRERPLLLVEDWTGKLEVAGYQRTLDWGTSHQTYLFEPITP